MWGLCNTEGYSVHIEPYCSASTNLDNFGMGQGPDVVAGLVMKAGITRGCRLYFDNLFTMYKLKIINYDGSPEVAL